VCDAARKDLGWRGWPAPGQGIAPSVAGGRWAEISHVVGPEMPNAHVFPKPRFHRLKKLPEDPLNVTMMEMAVHSGTHVDAPRHFFSDGPAFHEIPLDRLYGTGVVLDLEKPDDSLIDVADLEAARPSIEPDDIVVLHTGWWRHAGTPRYDHHPCLTPEAAHWLVERRTKLLACDFATPDLPLNRRPVGFDWPVHHILLGNGVLVAEHVTKHDGLAGRRAEFIFAALTIEESDGAPARVLARPI
jgi:kynurenine formamidase